MEYTTLPSTNIKILLPKERSHNRAIRELPSRQRSKCLLRTSRLLVLDIDLADTVVLPAAACGARHLDFEQGAVFGGFFFYVFEDLCFAQKSVSKL